MKHMKLGDLQNINKGIYTSTVKAFRDFNVTDETEIALYVTPVDEVQQAIMHAHAPTNEPFEYLDISDVVVTYNTGKHTYSTKFSASTKGLNYETN